MTRDCPRRRDDRGSLSLELCIASVIFLVLIVIVTALGRMAHSRGIVNGIARDAARAASLARTLSTAQADAQSAAQAALGTHSTLCQQLTVSVGGNFTAGGVVTVDVSCTASLAGLGLSGLPGSKTFTATARSPIDTLRTN